MENKELTKTLWGEFKDRGVPNLITREAKIPGTPEKAIAIIGMRRSGKTYFLYQQIRDLLDR